MIYCLASYDLDGNTLYKIGYTENMNTRLDQYLAHNPSCKLLKVVKGSRVDERCIHSYLHLKGYGKYRKEWYIKNDCIEEILTQPFDLITEYLWDNRKVVFSKAKLKNSVMWLNLYRKLERNKKNKRK